MMMRRKKYDRKLALMMSMGLIMTSVCPLEPTAAIPAATMEVTASENTMPDSIAAAGTIIIDSAEALADFSKKSTAESFTRGKRVVLTQDINLETIAFTPIAIFAGTFDGNGHTISGFTYSQAGSNLGLFRYVEEGAQIANLDVEGTLNPAGSKITVGGIAGVNRGTIENCRFFGSIMAEEEVGGIAGSNKDTGVVKNSENHAEVIGNRKVGGIAGTNDGTIGSCRNYGAVNTSKEGVVDEDDTNEYNFDRDALQTNLTIEKVNDIGGISGFSPGTIQDCENHGSVGYIHVGYNIGGIAGRQSGLIWQCRNYGAVIGRKDVGGIAGQFEPYLTVSYGRDTFDKLGDELDMLSDIGDTMSDRVEHTTDTASDNMDEVKDILKDIKDYTRGRKDKSKSERDAFDELAGAQVDRLQDKLDNINIDFNSSSAQRAMSRIRQNTRKSRELLNQLKSGTEEIAVPDDSDWTASIDDGITEALGNTYLILLELAACTGDIIADTGTVIDDGLEGIADGVHDLQDQLDEVRSEARALSDMVGDRKDEVTASLDEFDDEITVKLDRLSDQMDAMSDDLKSGKDQIRNEKNRMGDQLDVIGDVLDDGKDKARENMDKVIDEDDWIFDDISDEESVSPEKGTIIECTNQGAVTSDYQSGGIAGIIGFELSLDPEQDIDSFGDRSMDMNRYARATVSKCRNDGEITVEYNYAGGIVGKSNVGALIANQNYGNTTAVDGNYVGGIAGYSSTVRNNYSMNQVSGTNYLGGITGWGGDLKNNYAMTAIISEGGEWHGSIAGDADEDGEISGNYYVEEWLGAVDGISRSGEAVGLSYDEFIQMAQIPAEFSHITVTFVADDQVIESFSCDYGQALEKAALPDAPMKDGYYYVWEDADLSSVKGNLVIHAIYQPWTTTIASSADNMPFLLAEANFHPQARLEVTEYARDSLIVPKHYQLLQAYDCEIVDQNIGLLTEAVTFRVLVRDFGSAADIGIVTNGAIELTETRRDGNYLIFQMQGPGTFVILSHQKPLAGIAGFGIIAAGLLTAVIVTFYRKKKLPPII